LKNYTTKDIVNQIADTIRKDYPILLNYVNFDDWEKEFRAIENIHIVALFPEHIHGNFPLKNDVLKLIIKNNRKFKRKYKNIEKYSPTKLEKTYFKLVKLEK